MVIGAVWFLVLPDLALSAGKVTQRYTSHFIKKKTTEHPKLLISKMLPYVPLGK